jgi:hypothetical protein
MSEERPLMNGLRNVRAVVLLVVIFFSVTFFSVTRSSANSGFAQVEDPVQQVGIAEGEKAPDFKAVDQFGHEQTNKTLAARNGFVLLFFRSADW